VTKNLKKEYPDKTNDILFTYSRSCCWWYRKLRLWNQIPHKV